VNESYNIAIGERTTLNQLFDLLQTSLRELDPQLPLQKPKYQDFRPGDVRHSLADISKAQRLLGYAPKYKIADGINIALDWYLKNVI
jgi:UDP-N-acetylglucosamine 4-epimerase